MGEKGMTISCDINSLFIYMALLVTFPYFVHHLFATNIQGDKQAERRDNIISKRNWELEVSEMIKHLIMKKEHTQSMNLSRPKEPCLL